jgi:hypothetical protein
MPYLNLLGNIDGFTLPNHPVRNIVADNRLDDCLLLSLNHLNRTSIIHYCCLPEARVFSVVSQRAPHVQVQRSARARRFL